MSILNYDFNTHARNPGYSLICNSIVTGESKTACTNIRCASLCQILAYVGPLHFESTRVGSAHFFNLHTSMDLIRATIPRGQKQHKRVIMDITK